MKKIENKIELLKKICLSKSQFENEELKTKITTHFACDTCSKHINVDIVPYCTGYSFTSIYKNNYLTPYEILNSNMAKTALTYVTHLGEYLVSNLPTLYLSISCPKCNEKFILVFGYGEKQPNRWICKISGVWHIKIHMKS
jgi:hypothetical protein